MHMERVLIQAVEQQQLELRMPVLSAARGLHAVFCGVLHAWLLYPQAPFALEEEGMLAVSCYLQGLGFRVDAIKMRISRKKHKVQVRIAPADFYWFSCSRRRKRL